MDNTITIILSKELYPKESILKAAYNFTDRFHMYIDSNELNYIVDITTKDETPNEETKKQFIDEVITQTTRYLVMKETKNVRELILGRALASTLITDVDNGISNDGKENVEEILKDWFESENANS